MPTGADIVAAARGLLGTPWHHQGRLPGVGLDCGGVVVVAARLAGCAVDDHPGGYGPLPDGHSLRAVIEGQGLRLTREEEGAVALFAWERDPQHVAVLGRRGDTWTLIHAWAQARRVVEHDFTPEWRARLVHDALGPCYWRIPGVSEG